MTGGNIFTGTFPNRHKPARGVEFHIPWWAGLLGEEADSSNLLLLNDNPFLTTSLALGQNWKILQPRCFHWSLAINKIHWQKCDLLKHDHIVTLHPTDYWCDLCEEQRIAWQDQTKQGPSSPTLCLSKNVSGHSHKQDMKIRMAFLCRLSSTSGTQIYSLCPWRFHLASHG